MKTEPKKPGDIPEKAGKPSVLQNFSLLLVQSSACGVILLLALLVRLIGGDFYQTLGTRFCEMLTDDSVTASITSWMENDPLEAAVRAVQGTTPEDPTTTTETAQTSAATEQTAIGGHENDTASVPAMAPVTGAVLTSSFGERIDPFSGDSAYHGGMDLAVPVGTAVNAMYAGTVTDAGYEEGGYGNFVEITYGNATSYLYGHCSEIMVSVGESVQAGQTVALSGDTGRSTGPHLHIEWRINGEPYDPSMIVPTDAYV